MDPEALQAFEGLYAKVAGYKLSHRDRDERKTTERSFVYGEVLPDSFEALMAMAQPQPSERFVDLGCGVGKAVLLAALQFPFAELTGVEQLPSLIRASRLALRRFNRLLRPTLPAARRDVKLTFVHGDMRELDLRRVNVAFAHASCFERPLVEALTQKLSVELPSGARVVVVGRVFTSPSLELVRATTCQMDWGEATAAVYRKR